MQTVIYLLKDNFIGHYVHCARNYLKFKKFVMFDRDFLVKFNNVKFAQLIA